MVKDNIKFNSSLKCNCKVRPTCFNSRPTKAGYRTRSYRCSGCQARWNTVEICTDLTSHDGCIDFDKLFLDYREQLKEQIIKKINKM